MNTNYKLPQQRPFAHAAVHEVGQQLAQMRETEQTFSAFETRPNTCVLTLAGAEQNSLLANVVINNCPILAMVDCGAQESVLNAKVLEKIGLHREDLRPTSSVLTDASGAEMRVVGEALIELKLGTQTLLHRVLVADTRANYKMLLGLDVLRKLGAFSTDWTTYISFGDVRFQRTELQAPIIQARTRAKVNLPPHSLCVISTR